MFETVVIATDGSEGAKRSLQTAIDLTERFDGVVHALYVVDTGTIEASPEEIQSDLEHSIETAGEEALETVKQEATEAGVPVETVRRSGDPATEIIEYAADVDADAIAMGTRGRHGEHAFLLGSVAEAVVRTAPQPVLTVRQLEAAAEDA